MVTSSKGLESKNECADVGQEQLHTTDPSSRERGCYIRTMTAGVQLGKNSGRDSQGARLQGKLIGGKPPAIT
jgi:hypothetical protein